MTIRRLWVPLVVGFSIVGVCGKAVDSTVKWVGEMRKVMREGDLRGTISLESLRKRPHLYALGPLENLKGEITILDGTPSIATVRDSHVEIDSKFSGKACFLVHAQVEKWREAAIPSDVQTGPQLEAFVASAAKGEGIDIEKPFVFLVAGTVERATIHVVNNTSKTPFSPDDHDKIKVRFDVTNRAARVLGFYSDKHQGVFTHHDSHVHLHLTTDDGRMSGHVDELRLAAGGKLLLPAK